MKINEIQAIDQEIKFDITDDSHGISVKILLTDEETGLDGFVGGVFSLKGKNKTFQLDSYGTIVTGEMKEWIEKNKKFQRKIEEDKEGVSKEILSYSTAAAVFEELEKHLVFQ